MTPKAGRYVAGAATGLAIALSLTACKGASQDKASGGGKPADSGAHLTAAQNVLAKVSDQTSGVTSFRGTMSMSFGAQGRTGRLKGTMACRLKPSKAMKFTMSASSATGTNQLTELLVGAKLYMRMPELQAKTGKPWLGMSLSDLSKAGGVDLQSMQQGSQGDPALNVKMLTASKDVRQVGQETVGGVRTTHYEGTYSMADALARLSGEQRAQAQKTYEQAGIDKMSFNVWVDGRQLPRKVTVATLPGAKMETKMTMNYTAFNVPVSVTAPPKSQVADEADILGGGGQNIPG